MSIPELIGWIAAATNLLAYFQRTMLPLRGVAMVANALFVIYGAMVGVGPTLALNALLFVFNAWRIAQIYRETRSAKRARRGEADPIDWLGPLLRPVTFPEGHYIFRKGDAADNLYFLRSGEILLEEIGITLGSGDLFGEIAFLTDEKARTASARCITPCEVMAVDEAGFMRVFYQHPAFGMYVMRIMAKRLKENATARAEHAAVR